MLLLTTSSPPSMPAFSHNGSSFAQAFCCHRFHHHLCSPCSPSSAISPSSSSTRLIFFPYFWSGLIPPAEPPYPPDPPNPQWNCISPALPLKPHSFVVALFFQPCFGLSVPCKPSTCSHTIFLGSSVSDQELSGLFGLQIRGKSRLSIFPLAPTWRAFRLFSMVPLALLCGGSYYLVAGRLWTWFFIWITV